MFELRLSGGHVCMGSSTKPWLRIDPVTVEDIIPLLHLPVRIRGCYTLGNLCAFLNVPGVRHLDAICAEQVEGLVREVTAMPGRLRKSSVVTIQVSRWIEDGSLCFDVSGLHTQNPTRKQTQYALEYSDPRLFRTARLHILNEIRIGNSAQTVTLRLTFMDLIRALVGELRFFGTARDRTNARKRLERSKRSRREIDF